MSPARATDWRERINAAIRGDLSDEEIEDLAEDAGDWDYCAVGELQDALTKAGVQFEPTFAGWMPLDHEMQQLGIDFEAALEQQDFDAALATLIKIERYT